jgi:hypothetical protein
LKTNTLGSSVVGSNHESKATYREPGLLLRRENGEESEKKQRYPKTPERSSSSH